MSGPQAAHDPLAWGTGDGLTLMIAVALFVLGCVIHRRRLIAHGLEHASADLLVRLMTLSISIGPLLMILLDPAIKQFTALRIDLLELVMQESRLTLWLSAFIALINTSFAFIRRP